MSRLTQAARIARENGLGVWLQPRLIDQSHQVLLAHLAEAAGAAEELRREYGDIVLNADCEWTVFSDGIIQIVDGERQDKADGVDVALVLRQGRQVAAQEDHVHAGVITGQRREPVRRQRLAEPEVLLQGAAGGGDVLDVERYRK